MYFVNYEIQSRIALVNVYGLGACNILSFAPPYQFDIRVGEEKIRNIPTVGHVRARCIREQQHVQYQAPTVDLNILLVAPEFHSSYPWEINIKDISENSERTCSLISDSSESKSLTLLPELIESQQKSHSLDYLSSTEGYKQSPFSQNGSSYSVSCTGSNAKPYNNVKSTRARWLVEKVKGRTYTLSSSRRSTSSTLIECETLEFEDYFKYTNNNNNSMTNNEFTRFGNIDNTVRLSLQDYALPGLPEKEKSLLSKLREARESGNAPLSMPVPSYNWEEFKDTTNEQEAMVLARPHKRKTSIQAVPSSAELMETLEKVKAVEQNNKAQMLLQKSKKGEMLQKTPVMTKEEEDKKQKEELKSSTISITEPMIHNLSGPVVDYKERRRLHQQEKLEKDKKEIIAMTENALKERFAQRQQEMSNESRQLGNTLFPKSSKVMLDPKSPGGEAPKPFETTLSSEKSPIEILKPENKEENMSTPNKLPQSEAVNIEKKTVADTRETLESVVSVKTKRKSTSGKRRSMCNFSHPSCMCCPCNQQAFTCGNNMCFTPYGIPPQIRYMPPMCNFSHPAIFQPPQQSWDLQMGPPVPPQVWFANPPIMSSGDLLYDSNSTSGSDISSSSSSCSSRSSSSCLGSGFSSGSSSQCLSFSEDETRL